MQDLEKQETLENEQTPPLADDGTLPTQEEQTEKEPYTPRPLGFRIFALVLAIIVIIGMILWYYHIFTFR